MNEFLVAGWAIGGAVAGVALDVTAARVPPAPPSQDPDAPLAPSTSEPTDQVTRAATPSGVELVATAIVTAALFGFAAARIGPHPQLAAYTVLFAGLVAVSITDLRVGLVPRKILYPVLALTGAGLLGASAVSDNWRALVVAAISGAAVFAVFAGLWWAYPRGMGFGDVRLAGVMGAALGWLGPLHVYVGFVIAFVSGALFGVVLMVRRGTGRKTRLPFAPALSLGAVLGVLWGSTIISHWVPGHS